MFVCLFLVNGKPSEPGDVLSNRISQSLKLFKAWGRRRKRSDGRWQAVDDAGGA